MKISDESLKAFRRDFAETVKLLEEKHGLQISLGNIAYSFNEFHGKLSCFSKMSVQDTAAEQPVPFVKNPDQEKEAFERSCYVFDFAKDDYLMPVRVNGRTLFLCGFKMNAKKNACIIRTSGGKGYVTTPEFVKSNKALFGNEKSALSTLQIDEFPER